MGEIGSDVRAMQQQQRAHPPPGRETEAGHRFSSLEKVKVEVSLHNDQ